VPAPPPGAPQPAPELMPTPAGSGNQANEALGKYLDSTVQSQFMPMTTGCYNDLLSRRPGVSASMLLDVTIVGDQSVGGVVDSVTLDPGSAPQDDTFITCIRESMYGVVFKAPPAGQEKVTFTMPIDFSP